MARQYNRLSCSRGPTLLSGFYREWKTTKRAEVVPTAQELGWAAGFLEGEGSFTVTTLNKQQTRTRRIQCRQVNVEPLYRLLRIFGGTVAYVGAPSQRKVKITEWRCSGERAVVVMKMIYLLMSKKRQGQISKVLFCKTRKDG